MANRPRLPNVDPEDLAKLANQYPGSRPSSGTTDTAASGTSGPAGSAGTASTASSSSGSPSSGSGPTLSAAGAGRSGGGSGSGSGGGSSEGSGSATAGRKRGSWSAAFLTFLFALIAVAAAVAAIGAPSYRAEIHRLLTDYGKPYLADDTIDILSGQDTQRLEVTYDGLDQRIERLAQALERVTAAEGVSGDDARALLFRDETDSRLEAVTTRLEALATRTGDLSEQLSAETTALSEQLTVRSAEQGDALAALEAQLQTSLDTLQTSLASVQEDVSAVGSELGVLAARVAETEGSLEDQAALNVAMTDRFEAIDDRISNLVTDFNGLLDLTDQVAQTVTIFKNENMPILAVVQLRSAVDRAEAYGAELAFAQRVLSGAPGSQDALATLAGHAGDGIASASELRRDLRLIAENLGSFVANMESWSDRVSGWFTMLVGTPTVPEAREGGGLVSAIATIDEALERGDLELVIREGAALQAERRSPALADWLKAVVQRVQVTDALRKLEAVVYAQATAPSESQGAVKAQ